MPFLPGAPCGPVRFQATDRSLLAHFPRMPRSRSAPVFLFAHARITGLPPPVAPAAIEPAPRAATTATVAITFAYVTRGNRLDIMLLLLGDPFGDGTRWCSAPRV